MNTKFKNNQGITLIALIITIIILVILAAVSIRAVTNMGIVGHAINGTQDYARGTVVEKNLFDRVTELLDNTIVKINGIQDGCGITLNKDRLGLQLQGNTTVTEQLTATVVNLIGDVTWESSAPAVATVSQDGTVTAVSLGNTVITASIVFDGKEYTASCEVTITNVPVTSVNVTPTSVTINKNGTTTLTAEVGPANVTDSTVTWTTGNAQIATVDANGVVTGVAGGTTQITATANDGSGYSANCTVTVNVPVTGLALYKSGENANTAATSISATVEAEDTLTLVPVFTPNDASNKLITWSTSDANVATVSDGVVTGVAAGTVTITATANGGSAKTATCEIAVTPKPTSTVAFTVTEGEGANEVTTEYTWEDVHNIANLISADSTVTRTSSSATVTYEGKSITLNTGDEFDLVGVIGTGTNTSNYTYKVRIIGFNTDTLSSTGNSDRAYTNGGSKAGITFQFTNFFRWDGTNEYKVMNSTNTNKNGWGATAMRTSLNDSTTLARLTNNAYIKTVDKKYIETYNQTTAPTTVSADKLWLLACSEIWPEEAGTADPRYGYAKWAESDGQYKWYADNVTSAASSVTDAEKAKLVKKTTNYTANPPAYGENSAAGWWLRSPSYDSATNFCDVNSSGAGIYANAYRNIYVAPGFSI